jgi:outer membrane protein TolC
MNRKWTAVTLAGLILAHAAAAAEQPAAPPSDRLTLAAAVERALSTHPSVGAARAAADEAKGAKGEALAARFPNLRVAASGARHEEPAIVSPIHGFEPTLFPPFNETVLQGSATLGYTLFDGGARGGRIGRARASQRAAEASVDAAGQSIVSHVVRAYVDVVAKRRVLDAHEGRLEALESERGRVRQRYDVGRAAEVERLRIDAAVSSAEADRVRAAIQLDAAERDLARLIGGAQADASSSRLVPVVLADSILPPRDSLDALASRRSPALAAARHQEAAASAAAGAARGARWPELKLTGTYAWYGDPDGYSASEWNGALLLSQSLFTGGATTSAIKRADAARRQASEQVRLASLDLQRELDRALASGRESRARAASLASAVARYAEVARIQQLLLESGSGTQTDYLNAEADLLTARAALEEARADQIAARAELARVTGALDQAWIERTLEPAR